MRQSNKARGDRVLLEGPHLLGEALAAGLTPDEVYVDPGLAEADPEVRAILSRLSAPPVQIVEVAADVLAELADADAPKGLLAVMTLPRGGAETLPSREDLAAAPLPVLLYLDGVQDPGNLGAIARSAEAAGAAGLALSPGCAHPSHPRALRGSAGSLLRLPAAVGVTPTALDARLERPRWAALAVRGGRSLWELPDAELAGPLVLAVGAEGPGLSDEAAARADLRLTIPLAPPVESLNAAVAAALVLFELRRRSAS